MTRAHPVFRWICACGLLCALVLALAACSTSGVDVETANSSLPEATAVSLDADSVAEVLAEHGEVHAEAADTVWDEAAAIDISLDGGAIAVEGEGVTIEGSTAAITSAGTYRLSGSLVHIQNSAGEDLLTFAPTKAYQSIAFSSPEQAQGETYTVYTGGSTNGAAANGLYQDGAYTPGTERASFTIASIVTLVGNSRMR